MMTLHRMPLYLQIARAIEEEIRLGHWPLGKPIPSEKVLAAQFGVSIGTIRQAVGELVQSEHLTRRQGSGTYVNDFSGDGYWNRFQRFQSTSGRLIQWSSRLEAFQTVPAPPAAAEALRITEKTPITHVKRRIYRLESNSSEESATFCGLDETFLHPDYFSNMRPEDYDRVNSSLYRFYQESCGVVICDVIDKVQCDIVTPANQAQSLLPIGSPVLRLLRVARTFGKIPVEYQIENALARDIQLVFN